MTESARHIQPARLHPLLWLLAIPMAPLMAAILALAIALYVVAWPVLAIVYLHHRRRLLRRQRAAGCLMMGQSARERASADDGLLLVEVTFDGLGDVWFIAGPSVTSAAEWPLPALQPPFAKVIENLMSSDAITRWCVTELPALCKKASLVQMTRSERQQMLKELPLPFVRAIWHDNAEAFKA